MAEIVFGVLPGVLIGALIWAQWVRPRQLDNYERDRRSYGLPRRRVLPEDKG
jgi:hypothetical protein